MKISEAKTLLGKIVEFNVEQASIGKSHNTFVVPMFEGDPGVGKTAIPNQVAKELEIEYSQVILAQFDAGELAGLPVMNPDMTEMIRLRPHYLPKKTEENQGIGIFNLDELPQAFLANQNIASQIVNEYRVGEHAIPHGFTLCCTGNKPENKAGTTTMPSHLVDRLLRIPIEVDPDDWLTYAAQQNVDPRVRAFIRQHSNLLHNFKPGVGVCASPRSWEKTSAILSMNLPSAIRRQAILGQVGEGVGNTFEAWLRVENEIPKVEDIIANPENAPIFDNKKADLLYLLIASLADKATDKNIANIIKYLDRLPNQEFSVFCMTDAVKRDKKLSENKAFGGWIVTRGTKMLV